MHAPGRPAIRGGLVASPPCPVRRQGVPASLPCLHFVGARCTFTIDSSGTAQIYTGRSICVAVRLAGLGAGGAWCCAVTGQRPRSDGPERSRAGVAELVDALDLGSSAARRGGSSPLTRTRRRLTGRRTAAWTGRHPAATEILGRLACALAVRAGIKEKTNVCAGLSGVANRLVEGKTCRSQKRSMRA